MLTFKLMETATKIALSEKELQLVCDTGWILTKHSIIQKVYALFGETVPELQTMIHDNHLYLPVEVFINSPKISKGENYRLLPYVMLDYPRYFGKEDTIAVRTFFWWGNFFSVSLQLSGVFKANAELALLQHHQWLAENEYAVCINEGPWEHVFDKTNFVPVSDFTKEQFADILERKPFVKIAKKMPLKEWDKARGFIVSVFTDLAEILKNDQAPRR